MGFQEANKKGKYGEAVTKQFLEARGCVVVDTSSHPFFQVNGVDIVFEKDNKAGLMDVKTDYHSSNNLFIETLSNTALEKPGCIFSTKADWWQYYKVEQDTAYLFTPADMRAHIENNDFREVPTQTRVSQDAFYETRGLLVPISGAPIQATFENYSGYFSEL